MLSENTIKKISTALTAFELKIYNITLVCDKETLINRWKLDKTSEWRVDELLVESILSLEDYNNRLTTVKIDTVNKNIAEVVRDIINKTVGKAD